MSRIVVLSKDGKILAVGNDNELKVKNISNDKNTTNRLSCTIQSAGTIQMIKISPNNAYIAWFTKIPVEVQIKSLSEETCSLRLGNDKACIGFQTILWSPDSQFLLVVSKLSVYIDVINIKEKTVFKITGAVIGSNKKSLCNFSPDGEYFAVAERSQPATISIYTTDTWTKVQVLKIRGISNIGGLAWCLDSISLIVWQSLTHFQLTHCSLDGRVEHETKKDLMIVSTVAVAPNGRLIGILTDDFKVTVIDQLTWYEDAVFEHECVIRNSDDVIILKESNEQQQENSTFYKQIVSGLEVKDNFVALDPSKCSSIFKKRKLTFSGCSSYLATYEPYLGEAVWIWCLTKKSYLHSVILLDETISTINKLTWHPSKLQLIADIGVSKVLVWDLEKCFVIRAKDTTTTVFNSDLYLATLSIVQEQDDTL